MPKLKQLGKLPFWYGKTTHAIFIAISYWNKMNLRKKKTLRLKIIILILLIVTIEIAACPTKLQISLSSRIFVWIEDIHKGNFLISRQLIIMLLLSKKKTKSKVTKIRIKLNIMLITSKITILTSVERKSHKISVSPGNFHVNYWSM